MNRVDRQRDTMQARFMDSLGYITDGIVTWGGRALGAMILLIVGAIVATAIKSLIHRLLDRAHLDKHATKYNVQRFLPGMGLTDFLVKIVYWSIFLFFISLALDVLNIQSLSNALRYAIAALPQIFLATAILVAGAFLARFVKRLVEGYGDKLNESYGAILGNGAYAVVMYFAIVTAFEQITFIDISPITNNINTILIGVIGAAALALGLGGRSLAASLIGNRFIKDSLRVGDTLTLGDINGKISHINNAVVTVDTADGKVVIPISELV